MEYTNFYDNIIIDYLMLRKVSDMRSDQLYDQVMNELRINYQNYYDYHIISAPDFNKRRNSLILRLRMISYEREAQMNKQRHYS